MVAVIAAGGTIIAAMVQKGRKENSRDHKVIAESMARIEKSVDRVETKVDQHIRDHAKGSF